MAVCKSCCISKQTPGRPRCFLAPFVVPDRKQSPSIRPIAHRRNLSVCGLGATVLAKCCEHMIDRYKNGSKANIFIHKKRVVPIRMVMLYVVHLADTAAIAPRQD